MFVNKFVQLSSAEEINTGFKDVTEDIQFFALTSNKMATSVLKLSM